MMHFFYICIRDEFLIMSFLSNASLHTGACPDEALSDVCVMDDVHESVLIEYCVLQVGIL